MPYNERDFEPKRKPPMAVELFAWVFIYGPIFTFFYVIIKGLQNLFGY